MTKRIKNRERATNTYARRLRLEELEPRLALNADGAGLDATFLAEAQTGLDGSVVALKIQAYSTYPVVEWNVDWGDGQKTQTFKLGDSLVVSHFYQSGDAALERVVSLEVVDSRGVQSDDAVQLTTIVVPAREYESDSFVTDVFYDAEKGSSAQSRLCWAAGAANALVYCGWANPSLVVDQGGSSVSFNDEDDVYEYIVANFDNLGSSALYAFEWFVTGDYPPYGVSGWALPESGSGGFYPDVDSVDPYVDYYAFRTTDDPASLMSTLATNLRAGYAACAAAAYYSSNPGSTVTQAHTITVWGYETNPDFSPSDPEYYSAIIISDSDNNAYRGRNAPNTRETVAIEWNDVYNRYQMTGYSGQPWLEELIFLAPAPATLSPTIRARRTRGPF